ncbi:exopolysaccharide biosynthesis polyprenyl glycosylphosphotransferase [Deinococcus ruber]|uniref:exopolysaccharide biosynthesis polyprenyl glycosylphosphotransferase n=1 Tax=Deinococcus ruber TaxID=1848197 RepID=UPI001E2CF734|nr:exopolysaccharide biosynthesis polyprenyl glycosylphosphotransferase [Deinococcus ruber]
MSSPIPALPLNMSRLPLSWRALLNTAVLTIGDVLALGLPLALASQLVPWHPSGVSSAHWIAVAIVVWLCAARLLHITPTWGASAPSEIKGLTELTLLVFISLAGLEFLKPQTEVAEVLSLLLGMLLAWPLLIVTRPVLRRLLKQARLWGVPVVVYGGAQTGTRITQALLANPDYGYHPVGVFDDDPALQHTLIAGVPVLGSTLQAAPAVSVAILAVPGLSPEAVQRLLDGPLDRYRRVILLPDIVEMEPLWIQVRDCGGMTGLDMERPLLDPLTLAGKRLFDVLGVVLLAVPVLAVCVLIALALWLETRTSPLFFQQRVGRDGRMFTAWKFRTMLPNAEEVLRRTLEQQPELRAEWEATFKLRRDPRITRLGAVLRRTSLDELPQLMNVLRGEMSLVGPRPLPSYHCAELPQLVQTLRARVRPGMTGLWQVSGRSDAGNSGMVRWDSYYVRNWSIWLDLVILIRTVQVVVRGVGAY